MIRTFVNISLCIDKELSNISWSAVPLPIPIAHHKILMRYVLLPVFHFIITPGPYLRQPLNFPSKDQICLILNPNSYVATAAAAAGHWSINMITLDYQHSQHTSHQPSGQTAQVTRDGSIPTLVGSNYSQLHVSWVTVSLGVCTFFRINNIFAHIMCLCTSNR